MDSQKRIIFVCSRWVLALLVLFCFTVAAAETPTKIDMIRANKIFDDLSIQLSIHDVSKARLSAALETLDELKEQTSAYIKDKQKELDTIKKVSSPDGEKEPPKAINSEYKAIELQLSQGQLFLLRINKARKAYTEKLVALSTKRLLQRYTPIWKIGELYQQQLYQPFKDITAKQYLERAGFTAFTHQLFVGVILAVIIGLLAAYAIKYLIRSMLNKLDNLSDYTLALLLTLDRHIVILLALAFPTLLLYFSLPSVPHLPFVVLLPSVVLTGYCLYLALSMFLRPLPGYEQPLLVKDLFLARYVFAGLFLLGSCLLVYILCFYVFQALQLPHAIFLLLRLVLYSALTLTLVWHLNVFKDADVDQKSRKVLKLVQFAWVLMATLLSVLFFIDALGYNMLSQFILANTSMTLLYLFFFVCISRVIYGFFRFLNGSQYEWQYALHRFFGVTQAAKLYELRLLSFASILILFIGFMLLVLRQWGLEAQQYQVLIDFLVSGYSNSNVDIVPLRLLIAAIVLALLSLFNRWLRQYLGNNDVIAVKQQAQSTYASLISYVFMTVAILLCLFIAGAKMTGLLVVAGALSVGIGFGLKNLAADFVSGIILLLEKPVKPGDRIIVGGMEGFVRRINLRTTQVRTLMNSDVIVPNAELTSQPFTNYMYKDHLWRITVSVGVQYGTDTDLVRRTLLEVASQNPDIIQDVPNEPMVYFTRFADSSLNFEMWCMIRNVNAKFQISSDLNYAVNKAFKHAGIVIAFPQLDVHFSKVTPSKPKQAE